MPATIIGNSEWTSRGLVLTAQNAQEQVNGLVNVQVTYVGPASRHDQISRNFYLDAQPPIFPTVVSPSELVTNRLYMVSRSVSRENGLTTVQAEYVGGLQRTGFKGYFLSEQREQGKKLQAYNYAANFTGSMLYFSFITNYSQPFGPRGARKIASLPRQFIYDERIKVIEFVRVNGQASAQVPVFYRNDMASFLYLSK
jgi:hypothetical protein